MTSPRELAAELKSADEEVKLCEMALAKSLTAVARVLHDLQQVIAKRGGAVLNDGQARAVAKVLLEES